jgi:hypothetical protein
MCGSIIVSVGTSLKVMITETLLIQNQLEPLSLVPLNLKVDQVEAEEVSKLTWIKIRKSQSLSRKKLSKSKPR